VSNISKFFISLAVFIVLCVSGLYWFVNHEVERALNQAVEDVPGLSLTYADLSVGLSDHSVLLEKVEATLPGGQQVAADSLRITAFDQRNPVPHFATVQARGVSVQAIQANVGDWAGPLVTLGVSEIRGDLDLDYRYEPQTQTLTVNTLVLSVPDLGDVRLKAAIDRLDLTQLRVEKLLGLRMVYADLVYADRALVGLLLGNTARLLNVSEAEARTRVRAEITAMADYAARDSNPVAAAALAGLADFVADPGQVAIASRPGEPVPVLYFFMGRDFYENLHLLNVTVITDAEHEI